MTTAQVVETSVTVNNNSPIRDYVHPDDQTQPTFEMTPGFKPFTLLLLFVISFFHFQDWPTQELFLQLIHIILFSVALKQELP